ncbi:MAG: hypothetical protein LBS55_11365, partial [Prevotellaceae bacterium]|nr:hypothetical protein [Prevotellaceae bacterium]
MSRQGHNVGRKCVLTPPAPVPSGTECRCFSAYSVPAERYIRGRICRDGACTVSTGHEIEPLHAIYFACL